MLVEEVLFGEVRKGILGLKPSLMLRLPTPILYMIIILEYVWNRSSCAMFHMYIHVP